MKVSDIVLHRCGNCVYFRAVSTPKDGFCTVYDKDTSPEDKCEHFANIAVKGNFQKIKAIVKQESKK